MLSVKAVTLIFIFRRGSAISSAQEEKSGFYLKFGEELHVFICSARANVRAFHENPNRIHTELILITLVYRKNRMTSRQMLVLICVTSKVVYNTSNNEIFTDKRGDLTCVNIS